MSSTAYTVTITVTIETEDQDLGSNRVEDIMADAIFREHDSDFRITSLKTNTVDVVVSNEVAQ
jgi:hypothetical protein